MSVHPPASPAPASNPATAAGPAPGAPATLLAGLGILACGALAGLALACPPDGVQRGGTAEFIGRFHPLIVHLPIGLLLLVPVLELAGRRASRAHLAATAGFVATCAAAVAVAAAAAGWLLGRSGGYVGPSVATHMWAGIGVAALAVLTAWVRHRFAREAAGRRAYALLLIATLGMLAWAGHQGGELTHGDHYLTERMPGRLRHWLGLPPLPPPPPPPPLPQPRSLALLSPGYAAGVAPLLRQSCVSCHCAEKHKCSLRLDTYADLMKGGEDGRVVVPGHPEKSELIRRVVLPPDDDDFMPSDGRHPLTPVEIRLIRLWIGTGANHD